MGAHTGRVTSRRSAARAAAAPRWCVWAPDGRLLLQCHSRASPACLAGARRVTPAPPPPWSVSALLNSSPKHLPHSISQPHPALQHPQFTWLANASFSSNTSTSSLLMPARSSALGTCDRRWGHGDRALRWAQSEAVLQPSLRMPARPCAHWHLPTDDVTKTRSAGPPQVQTTGAKQSGPGESP